MQSVGQKRDQDVEVPGKDGRVGGS